MKSLKPKRKRSRGGPRQSDQGQDYQDYGQYGQQGVYNDPFNTGVRNQKPRPQQNSQNTEGFGSYAQGYGPQGYGVLPPHAAGLPSTAPNDGERYANMPTGYRNPYDGGKQPVKGWTGQSRRPRYVPAAEGFGSYAQGYGSHGYGALPPHAAGLPSSVPNDGERYARMPTDYGNPFDGGIGQQYDYDYGYGMNLQQAAQSRKRINQSPKASKKSKESKNSREAGNERSDDSGKGYYQYEPVATASAPPPKKVRGKTRLRPEGQSSRSNVTRRVSWSDQKKKKK